MSGFKNPVAAGSNLIRDALQSPEFEAGDTGWQVRRDGGAEFNNLAARGDVTVGANQVSIARTLALLAASGTNVQQFFPGQDTTSSYQSVSSNWWRNVKNLVDRWSPDIPATTVFDVSLQVNLQFHPATASAGDHLYMDYIDTGGVSQTPFFFQSRAGNETGSKTGSIAFIDSFNKAKLDTIAAATPGGVNSGGYVNIRNTGATAYTLDLLSVFLSWRARI